jgi:hypothetical protein
MKRKTLITIPLIMATVVTALWATDALTIGPIGAVSINGNLTVDGVIHDAHGQVMPAGDILAFAGATPPSGWLMCDGSEISRTEYQALSQVIQDTWVTASDSTKFKLPDLRAAFSRGTGTHGSQMMTNRGSYLGPPDGRAQPGLFQRHYHSFRNASDETIVAVENWYRLVGWAR